MADKLNDSASFILLVLKQQTFSGKVRHAHSLTNYTDLSILLSAFTKHNSPVLLSAFTVWLHSQAFTADYMSMQINVEIVMFSICTYAYAITCVHALVN